MNRCHLAMSIFVLLVACTPAESGWNSLHPKTTADCTHWLDGSYFPIGSNELGRNDVGASRPETEHGAPILRFVYFVSAGDMLRLNSTQFAAVSASNSPIAVGHASLLLNPNVKGEEFRYAELPVELRGSSANDQRTLYHVVVRFREPLPPRFDIVLPEVWAGGKKYPVRVFGYNVFPEKGTLGLCN